MSELIAEARVLVTPDTTQFRTLLETQLVAITKALPPVPVTITPVVAKTGAAASGISEIAGAETALAATQQARIGAEERLTRVSMARTEAVRLQATAVKDLAAAEAGAVNASSAVAAAQINATRAQTALAAARKADTVAAAELDAARSAEAALTREASAATAQNTVVMLQNAEAVAANTAATLANAQALAVDTQEALANARAQQARFAAITQSSKGAASAALSFLGLRGATLAAGGAFLAGAAGVIAFGKAVQSAAQLETSLNTFRVTADATANDMERIREVAVQLGTDLTLPGVTANSAADALSQLSRAGLSVEDSISGVRGTLQLATAAAIDNEQAVQLVAGALNTFKLQGTDAARVADLLAASSKESQGSIIDVGLALQQSAAAAAQAGVSVQDTIALLTELGRAGLRGSDAGTSLRVALLRLIAPSKQAKEALEGLGVAIRDEQGNVRPEVFADITAALSGFTRAQRDATLALIFGQDAFRAASIIGREGAAGLREMQQATQEVGVAAELAAARTQGLSGAVENMKNQFQELGRNIGEVANPFLTEFANVIGDGIGNINTFISFLGGISDEAPRTEQSIADLADEFARLNKEAGGSGSQREAFNRVQALGKAAAISVLDFADLTREAGRLNRAIFELRSRGIDPQDSLVKAVTEINAALEDTQPAALTARDGIEDFRSSLTQAARDAEAFRQAITPPEGFLPKAPELPTARPRQRVSTREGQAELAESQGQLREAERIREQILENAIKAERAGIHKSVEARQRLFDERVAAEKALNATRAQIAAQSAADASKAAAAEEKAAKERAAAFLAAQDEARAAPERLVSLAGETQGLRDDIQRRQALRVLQTQQIKAIRDSTLDEKTKREAIKALAAERQQTTDEINRLSREDAAQRKAQAEQAQEERESALIALGQSILDLTGNKNPILRAIDAAIKDAQAEKARAKKGSLAFIQAQTEINNLLKRRKDILEDVQKAGSDDLVGGTTLVDLFEKAQQIASGAGNVGGINAFNVRAQPRIQAEVQERLDIVNDPAVAAAQRQVTSTDRLVQAIDRLTETLTGGNASTAGPVGRTGGTKNMWKGLTEEQRFYYQRQAKQMVEQGLGG